MSYHKTLSRVLIGASLISGFLTLPAAQAASQLNLAAVQELVRGNMTEPASLDPHVTEGVPESHLIRDLLEGLVNQDADGGTVPGVAESWETSDNKTFLFHLRKNARWSNGDPVTAHDFVYSFRRAADPATASPYAWYLEMTTMVNAAAIIAGKSKPDTLGVEAIDDHTLKVSLEQVVPYLVKMMAHTTVKPVHRATIEKYGNQWTRPGNYVSNGAYKLSSWVVNERIEMVRNENYWDNENTTINKVTFLPIEDQVTEMNRFLAGEMDFTYEVPLEHFRRLQKEHPESVLIAGSLCVYHYEFNNKKAPFDDVRVRQALSYAIDREIITDKVLGQGQIPAYSFTPAIVDGFVPPVNAVSSMSQQQRNAKAKQLLEEAGYGDRQLELTLLYNTSGIHKKVALAVAQMWKKALGVKVKLENQEWKTYLQTRRDGNQEVSRAGWCGDYNEASTFLSLLQSNNSSNTAFYYSDTYDGFMKQALNAKTSDARNQFYSNAELTMAQDMPIAPIFHYVRTRLLSPRVGGFPVNNAEEKVYSKDLYIKAD
ncbi:MAG: oligopeptide ABC transporter substrate-binding protein OppA [Gammaproteobacteria bacterium]|nr:oligopeptide ABC transporter substrate-binding protein OppA [Gammaproteobacteria bacterium]